MFELSNIQMDRGGRTILSIPSLRISDPGLTIVLGHNGSGKSTLVSLLSGQQAPDSGTLALNNRNISHYKPRELAKQIAFLPQKLPASAALTVSE